MGHLVVTKVNPKNVVDIEKLEDNELDCFWVKIEKYLHIWWYEEQKHSLGKKERKNEDLKLALEHT